MSGITAAYLDELHLQLHGVAPNGEVLWRLTREFRFDSRLLGARLIVDPGLVTDLASVPRFPGAYLVAGGFGQGPAVLHDWACQIKLWSWQRAASLFWEASNTDGTALGIPMMPRWRRQAMYRALQVAGFWRWREYPLEPPA